MDGRDFQRFVHLRVRPDHRTEHAIPHPLPGSYYNPCISGSKVAFQGGRTGAYDDVYVYDVDSKTLRPGDVQQRGR